MFDYLIFKISFVVSNIYQISRGFVSAKSELLKKTFNLKKTKNAVRTFIMNCSIVKIFNCMESQDYVKSHIFILSYNEILCNNFIVYHLIYFVSIPDFILKSHTFP